MGAVTPEETLGTLYTFGVGTNQTKQHAPYRGADTPPTGGAERERERERERVAWSRRRSRVVEAASKLLSPKAST